MNAGVEPVEVAADDDGVGWGERNQRWLAVRLARLHERVIARLRPTTAAHGAADVATAPDAVEGSTGAAAAGDPSALGDFVPALERIGRAFGLSGFERDLLLLAAGVELDEGLRTLLPGGPTFSQALALLPVPHWDAISPQRPLRYWRMLEPRGESPVSSPLRIDERLLLAIAGLAAFDERLAGIAAARPPAGTRHPVAARAAALLAAEPAPPGPMLVWIDGTADPALLLDLAIDAAHEAVGGALVVAAWDLPAEPHARMELARRLDREAVLSDTAIVLWSEARAADPTAEAEAARRTCAFIDACRTPLLLVGRLDAAPLRALAERRRARVVADAEADDADETRRVVARHAALPGIDAAMLQRAVRVAAGQFRVPSRVLDECIERIDPRADDPAAQLWHLLREASRGGLDTLATRIDLRAGLDDLVLPAAQRAQLEEIAEQLAHRHTVHHDWGFAERGIRGLGVAALFCGESGTGKTMAAEAIAGRVGLDLYRVDLARTVSKYIGETEKNLSRIFDAAEASGAVLLFDEADALFGKRSEVKDSHDRYANIEVAYLLQRIESYRGLAVLTTNLKSSLDRAFLRRIRFVVHFPFPDEPAREALWRGQWPARAPVGEIDFRALARMPLAGGHIRSVALNAAFLAAADGAPIGMTHLRHAVQREAAKLERALLPEALGRARA